MTSPALTLSPLRGSLQHRVGHAPGMAWTVRGTVHPMLPEGEGVETYSSSSNVTATSPFALNRTTPSSTPATSPSEMK